ncbi:MAG: hypothetical protein AAF636_13730 [Pseudomonadota bacterium]
MSEHRPSHNFPRTEKDKMAKIDFGAVGTHRLRPVLASLPVFHLSTSRLAEPSNAERRNTSLSSPAIHSGILRPMALELRNHNQLDGGEIHD